MEELKLKTITKEQHPYFTNFKEIIEKRTILKTKLKLLQIVSFDQDLKKLLDHELTIYNLGLEDFKLNEQYELIVPVEHKIIKWHNDLKLRSYFIYLSYLYQFDFLSLYENPSSSLYKLLYHLNLPNDLRENLLLLLEGREGKYFSSYLEELNSPEFRNVLYETTRTLHYYSKYYS